MSYSRLVVEQSLKHSDVTNKYDLVILLSYRAKSINSGDKPLLDEYDKKQSSIVTAIEEIEQKKLPVKQVKENISNNLVSKKINQIYSLESSNIGVSKTGHQQDHDEDFYISSLV